MNNSGINVSTNGDFTLEIDVPPENVKYSNRKIVAHAM